MVIIDDIRKNYGDFSLNVSMKIQDGRITGLVGKNGAGKSTVIKSILGLISPDAGSVSVFGKDARTITQEDKQKIDSVIIYPLRNVQKYWRKCIHILTERHF